MVPQQETDDGDNKTSTPTSALKSTSTTSGTQEPVVQGEIINHQPEAGTRRARDYRASAPKKVMARTMPHASTSSLNSLNSQISSLNLDPSNIAVEDNSSVPSFSLHGNTTEDLQAQHNSLLSQVFTWLQTEKAKLASTTNSERGSESTKGDGQAAAPSTTVNHGSSTASSEREYPGSHTSEGLLALDKLETIIAHHSHGSKEHLLGLPSWRPKGVWASAKRAAVKGLRRGSASDSDSADIDPPVPSADVVLDNSKTLLFSGGEADSDVDLLTTNSGNKPVSKDREYWFHFKSEILRLTHTLEFKGWRRVPLDAGGEIEVVRLSGALTNAVYVVSPPKNLNGSVMSPNLSSIPKRSPPKLLLRIYGPQVEHLIDRENELQILRRLARKNIGPRVLGTFNNGRFEEYLEARTLTAKDLRIPDTSVQIAKRMRELHDGIELYPEEREAGPTLWKNWDKWVNRCEKVITWLDKEILSEHNSAKAHNQPWRARGFVCGVPWSTFRSTVDRYRKWLDAGFGGPEEISRRLVFAHNDTQYGNLLRLQPGGKSPLLLPANEHKQLVVIDFEYSSANMRGVEFSNHFTEWCYNYHDENCCWACSPKKYPTPEEQKRFIRAYITHRPRLPHTNTESAPYIPSQTISTSSISSTLTAPALQPSAYGSSPRVPPFALDNHAPSAPMEDELDNEEVENEVAQLLRETRLWRVANSAQWVAWGIVQAHEPGMDEALNDEESKISKPELTSESESEPESVSEGSATTPTQETVNPLLDTPQVIEEVEVDEAADEFDYLGYAQERALFFWADVLSLGLIKEDEIPPDMLVHIKDRMIDY